MNLLPPELRVTLSPVVALAGDEASRRLVAQLRASWPKPPAQDALGEWEAVSPHYADLDAAPPVRAREAAECAPKSAGEVLKEGWWRKHALLVPAAAAILAPWREGCAWQPVAEQVAAARTRLRPGVKVLVVLVAEGAGGAEASLGGDERVLQLIAAAGLEPRAVLSLRLVGLPAEAVRADLLRLERALLEAADEYYREQAKRARRMRELAPRPSALSVRYELKAAFFAHMRRDGAAAERHYSAAHALLAQLVAARFGPPPVQSGAGASAPPAALVPPGIAGVSVGGVKGAAEACALQLLRLLVLAGRCADAAEGWAGHCAAFGRLAGDEAQPYDAARGPERGAAHWAWLCRQHYCAGQLLEAAHERAARAGGGPPAAAGAEPAYHYERAAACARARRAALPPGRALEDSALILELLGKAHERQRSLRRGRLVVALAARMAAEYAACANHEMAASFYARVLDAYRRERWHAPAAEAARRLRACAAASGRTAEWASLGLGCLPRGTTPGAAEAQALLDGLYALGGSAPGGQPPGLPPLGESVAWADEPGGRLARALVSWEAGAAGGGAEPAGASGGGGGEAECACGEPATLRLRLEWLGACPLRARAVRARLSGPEGENGDGSFCEEERDVLLAPLSPRAQAASAARAAAGAAASGSGSCEGCELGAVFGAEVCIALRPSRAGRLRLLSVELVLAQLEDEAGAPVEVRIIAALAPAGTAGAGAGARAPAVRPSAAACGAADPLSLLVRPPAPDAAISLRHSAVLLVGEMAPLSVRVVAGPSGIGAGARLLLAAGGTAEAAAAAASAAAQLEAGAAAGVASPAGASAQPPPSPLALFVPAGGGAGAPRPLGSAPFAPAALARGLRPGEACSVLLLARAAAAGTHALEARLSYSASADGASMAQEVRLSRPLACAPALGLCVDLAAGEQGAPGRTLWQGGEVALVCELACVCPPPAWLELVGLEAVPAGPGAPPLSVAAPGAAAAGDARGDAHARLDILGPSCPAVSPADPVSLRPGDAFRARIGARALGSGLLPSGGLLRVRWRRRGGFCHPAEGEAAEAAEEEAAARDLVHESLAPIPQVHVCPCPLSASVSLPVGGTVGELTALSVEVANHSAALQEVALSFADNESFLFAGFKHCTLRLPPGGLQCLTYNLMPICAGHVALPNLQVVARPVYGGAAFELVDNSEPRLVFVLPQPLAQQPEGVPGVAVVTTS